MARSGCLVILAVVCLVGLTLGKPANDMDKATDVHLNSVLPERERGAVRLTQSPGRQRQAVAPQLAQLETMSEEQESTQTFTTETVPEVVSNKPSYFSRIIQSIFDIPISILESVRNLVQTTGNRHS